MFKAPLNREFIKFFKIVFLKSFIFLALSFGLTSTSNATVINYQFTADGGYSGSFSYDNTISSNGTIPYGQGGPSYEGLSFELNGVALLNPIIQIFNDYQSIHDIVYFTTASGGPSIQLWGDANTIGGSGLGELDNISLSSFSNTASNLLYLGVYPSNPTTLLSFSIAASNVADISEPSTLFLMIFFAIVMLRLVPKTLPPQHITKAF